MGLDLPPIPPHLQEVARHIDQNIQELKSKGAEQYMEDWKKSGIEVAPILDIEVLELQKMGLAVTPSGHIIHHQILHGAVWNKLLDMTYNKVRTEIRLKHSLEKIESLKKELEECRKKKDM
jgi:hypothetical protein